MRYVAACLLILVLSGCAAQQQAQREVHYQDEFAGARAYCHNLLSSSSVDPVRQKVMTEGEPTFEMLANEEKPTQEERTAIRAWAELSLQCLSKFGDVFQRNLRPIYLTLYKAATDNSNALRAGLYNGQINYGQYNREAKRILNEWWASWQRLDAEYAHQNAEAQYRAQQQAQQTYQNFLLYQQNLQQQQTLFQQQHGTVACNRIGTYTYCNY